MVHLNSLCSNSKLKIGLSLKKLPIRLDLLSKLGSSGRQNAEKRLEFNLNTVRDGVL